MMCIEDNEICCIPFLTGDHMWKRVVVGRWTYIRSLYKSSSYCDDLHHIRTLNQIFKRSLGLDCASLQLPHSNYLKASQLRGILETVFSLNKHVVGNVACSYLIPCNLGFAHVLQHYANYRRINKVHAMLNIDWSCNCWRTPSGKDPQPAYSGFFSDFPTNLLCLSRTLLNLKSSSSGRHPCYGTNTEYSNFV
jgi:hypothetical protein